MSAPRLNIPLVLESPERVGDSMGGHVVEWRVLGRLWAEMKSQSGAERAGEIGAASVVNWRITVRAAPAGDPRRPRPDQRLRMEQRVFRIQAVAEQDRDGRFLTCMAKEEAAV